MDIAGNDIFGWFALTIQIVFYCSPSIHFLKLLKGKVKYDDIPGIFVLINYYCTYMWYVNGIMLYSYPLKITNLISCVCSGILLLIYLKFEAKEYLADSILNVLILIASTWAIYRALAVVIDDDDIVYYICLIANTLVYLSPLQLITRVCQENNYELFPMYSAYISLFNCPIWIIYSLTRKEYYVTLVYFIGLISSLIQIFISLRIKSKRGKALKQRESTSIVDDEINNSSIDTKIKSVENPIESDDGISGKKIKERPVKIHSSKKSSE